MTDIKIVYDSKHNSHFQVLNDPGGQVVLLERGRDTPSKKIFQFLFQTEIKF